MSGRNVIVKMTKAATPQCFALWHICLQTGKRKTVHVHVHVHKHVNRPGSCQVHLKKRQNQEHSSATSKDVDCNQGVVNTTITTAWCQKNVAYCR